MSETPEHILRQTGKVVRPDGCSCDDGFWMRTLVDPGCHYHSDYGEELREQLKAHIARIAALEEFVSACRYAGPDGVKQLRLEAQKLFPKNCKNKTV